MPQRTSSDRITPRWFFIALGKLAWERSSNRPPYAMKNQRGASKISPDGGILHSIGLMPELVLYGIRLLAKQFLGTFLDIEVDQSESNPAKPEVHILYWW